jgi:poly(hydroxyalkanoate) depolymerase family esterase
VVHGRGLSVAKRRRASGWASLMQRSMTAFTRTVMKAGSRAVTQAVGKAAKEAVRQAATPPLRPAKPARRARAASAPARPRGSTTPTKASRELATLAPDGGRWVPGSAGGPGGVRRFHLYLPPGASTANPAPLLVMLHGCGQTARAFALSTRMNRLAAQAGWCVLYPAQDRRAHPQGCWNWYATRSGAAQAEAATLLAAVEHCGRRHPVDTSRVAVAGLSAGAGMAALLACAAPARFRAVVMHSGVAPGAADSTASALSAMFSGRRAAALGPTEGEGGLPLPPLLVIHGSADHVVTLANARHAVDAWAAAAGARATAARRVQRGQRRPMTITEHRRGGRSVATLCEVEGLAHAWSGGAASQEHGDPTGPDAARLLMAFVARAFAGGQPSARSVPPRLKVPDLPG